MRILFLSNFYPPYELGGYPQLCQEVVLGLKAKGHDVHVLTSRYRLDEVTTPEPDVTRALYLDADIDYYRPLDFFFKRRGRQNFNHNQLLNAINRFEPDIVFVWGMWNLSLTLLQQAEYLLPGRVAYFIASYWPEDVDPHTSYWHSPANHVPAKIIKWPLRQVAMTMLAEKKYPPQLQFRHAKCVSWYVRDKLVQAGKLPAEAGVIYNGILPEPFLENSKLQILKEQQTPLQLLYFGRLIHDKGVHTALEALNLLKQRGLIDGVHLTILGGGHPAYEAYLKKMVVEFGLQAYVEFIGQVPRDEIPGKLAGFDVCLFTSIWPEPIARSVMEAMAAGLLVIGTEVGGQTEMLHKGQNALTFQAEDAVGLADQIAYAIENPALCLQMAQAGQQMILEKFTIERMINEIETYLLQLNSS